MTGTVVDASTNAPVADVVVTATSPQLQGEQLVLTDATGSYHVSQLPPGAYTLRFEKETYKPYSRAGITLDADHTLRLNVQLLPEVLKSEEVMVLGKPPLIDVGSTQSGLTVTSAFADAIPVSQASAGNGGIRSYSGLALAAPQVSTDLFGISIAGTTSPENAYLIDGLSFSDTGFGVSNRGTFATNVSTAGSDFSVEFVDQVNVLTGGYMPEYGRTTGGVLSVTTKSGGNEFHGSVFATWTPAFLAQTGRVVTNAMSVIGESSKLYNAWDTGFTLGGYLEKDKLWFFVGFNPSQYKTQVTRTVTPFDANGNPGPQVFSQNYYQTQTDYSYIGKLTYLINSDNRISLTVAGMPDSYKLPYAWYNGDYTGGSYAGDDNAIDAILRLNSSFLEKKLLLDITVGWHHQNNNVYPIDGSSYGSGDASIPYVYFANSTNLENFPEDPALRNPQLAAICNGANGATQCGVANYSQGGSWEELRNVTENRVQAKAILTWFLNALGHQTWKAGVDVEYITYEDKLGWPGRALYFNLFSSPVGPGYYDLETFGYLSGPDTAIIPEFLNQTVSALLPGLFLQDSWNVLDKVTLNAGVRFDSEYIYNGDGQLALPLTGEWSPRVGIIWDPTYQGKSKIYASYAIYYEAVPLDLADWALTGREMVQTLIANCNNPAATGVRCSTAPSNLVGGGAGPNQYWTAIGADKELVDPNIEPQTTDEFQLGAEYQIFPNARLGLNYTHRGLSRLMDDYSNNSAASYVLGNPGQGIASNFVQPARIYNAYTIALTKTFADHWQAQASYTYASLVGNVDGLYDAQNSQLDPNITSSYDLPQFLINSFGRLPNDVRHRIKVYGSYQFLLSPSLGLTLGLAYNGQSGTAISALGGDLLYGGDVIFIIPRGSYGQLPWVNQLDLHATVDLGLGGSLRLSFGIDCFNVLGSQTVTALDQSWVFPYNTPTAAEPNATPQELRSNPLRAPNGTIINPPAQGQPSILNANFGHATAYQSPRNFRLLGRFSF
ncbi:MAG: TonB-dependent receptor domain-containing protein [Myxococcaceae bacterium]